MTAPAVPLDQVEWRADSEPYDRNGGTVCRWVPYLNAPIVARLLDEWVGPDGWSDKYESGSLAGKEVLWCHLDIGGVVKSDVGVASNTEAQKGIVSDAFKRAACLKWGVGRNVYELPTLFAKCGVNQRGDKRYAKEIPETLPDILRQLKARGFDADGGSVREADAPEGVDDQGAEIAGNGGEPDPSPEDKSGTGASTPSASSPPASSIDSMKPRELADALRERGLEAVGTVAEMRDQLRQAVAA